MPFGEGKPEWQKNSRKKEVNWLYVGKSKKLKTHSVAWTKRQVQKSDLNDLYLAHDGLMSSMQLC